jgi:hypothetical protein
LVTRRDQADGDTSVSLPGQLAGIPSILERFSLNRKLVNSVQRTLSAKTPLSSRRLNECFPMQLPSVVAYCFEDNGDNGVSHRMLVALVVLEPVVVVIDGEERARLFAYR